MPCDDGSLRAGTAAAFGVDLEVDRDAPPLAIVPQALLQFGHAGGDFPHDALLGFRNFSGIRHGRCQVDARTMVRR
jgi:hypothetical protein